MEDSANKQSSTSTTLRAAVTLCLLVSIPSIAMFDRPLRDAVRRYFPRGPAKSAALDNATKRHSLDEEEEDSTWLGPRPGATNAGQPEASGTMAQPPPAQTPPSDVGLLPGPHGSDRAWLEAAPRDAGGRQPIERPPWQQLQPQGDPAKAETFDTMHRRLEQLGATYYLLETWGRGGALYRFHCKMAIGENPNFTRQFEATDSNPMVAMRRVLDEVESWSAKRRY